MATWREVNQFHQDAKAMRALAKRLLKMPFSFTPWEYHFLKSIANLHDVIQFTTRQAEKLLQIRDDSEFVTETYLGFSVETLLRKCREARLDLSEPNEAWVMSFDEGTKSMRRRDTARLLRCARELSLIESEFDRAA